jgi:hypothetical protein
MTFKIKLKQMFKVVSHWRQNRNLLNRLVTWRQQTQLIKIQSD